ncbi:TolC family protein [Spirochaeta africana]|nr:TolC family protein [Spirochaeta africana]
MRTAHRTPLLPVVLLLLISASLTALPAPSELDIDTAVELALANNLGIRSHRIDAQIAERNYQHRFNVLYPQISAQGTLARPNAEPEDPFAGLMEQLGFPPVPDAEDPPRWNMTGTLSAQLTLASQMIHGIRAVTDAYHNAEIELDDARRELEKQIRTSFYQLLLQQEQLDLSERRLAATRARLEEVQQNYEAGLVDELTLRRTQVALENQRPGLLRQRQGYATAKHSLAAALGVDSLENTTITGSIEQASLELADESALLQLIDRNPDIQAARRGIQGMETRIDLTRAEMLPTLTFAFSLNPGLSGDPFSSDPFDTDNWSDRGSFSMTLRQPLDPLLPGSSTRQNLANQRDELQQAHLRVEQARSGVALQTRRLLGEITAARETIESLQANVALAERAFELAEEAYQSGLRDFSVVRDAEIDLGDARLQLLQEQHRSIELLLELEYLLNTPHETMKEIN